MSYAAVVIGASAGGIAAVDEILRALPSVALLPMILALHMRHGCGIDCSQLFRQAHHIKVVEAEEKTKLERGHLYVAPPGYHVLCERDQSLSLSNDVLVNWARPSIDVLFESAAAALHSRLVGVILTGANSDGAAGLKRINELGGLTIVQDPATAAVASMPSAAISGTRVDHVLSLAAIGTLLASQSIQGDLHAL